ncbi:hypothetical protein O181_067264 [Austropuccinia psidii MF-1]|uniref:Uncharacterized protein n=1 Tax=Austropuccinia psidii MF-1 TaxID=1389203 RepID=A0A9Q3EUK8_9BASI|nr:hypothetical protein [Austropuccinia psidii MF-1]
MLPTLLTILTLIPPDTAYHPSACEVHSRHAPNTAYHPYACGVPSHVLPTLLTILTLAKCPPTSSQHCLPFLRCGVHSRHCLPSLHSLSALPTCSRHCLPSLRLCSALPTCSRHHLSLGLCSALPTCSRHHLSLRFRITSIVYGALLAYTLNAIAEIL